jgi:tetratricopeptide (TPR) repeat protein
MPLNLVERSRSEVPEPRDHSPDVLGRIAAGRGFLRARRPADALREFEAAYDASKAALDRSATGAGPAALRDFVTAAYWRSAAFNQLSMLTQADEETSSLLRFTADEGTRLGAAERGLIHYARGRYYLERHALYDAIACFENALDLDNTLERALRDRIRAYRSIDSHAALYYAMQAAQDWPESFDLRHMLLLSLLDAGLWGLAEHEARALVAEYPHQQPTALTSLAQAMAGQGRIAEALVYCTRALELDDASQEAQEQMSLLLRPVTPAPAQEAPGGTEAGSVAATVFVLEPLVDFFAPDITESVNEWLEEAAQNYNTQDYPEALKLFDFILENDPGNVEAICGRINCLRLTYKFLEAKAEAESAVERDLTSWQLCVGLGRLQHAEGNFATALDWYDKADAEQHGSIEIGIARSNTLCAQGNAGAASDLIDELIKLNGENIALRQERAWVAFFQRDYGEAESIFRELYAEAQSAFRSSGDTESAAEMARMSYGLGYVAMKQGDNFGALEHFSAAKEKFNITDYRLAHAWAQAQRGNERDLKEARATCRELVHKTGSPLAYNCLGVVYFKLGHPTDARTQFEIAARSGPAYACHVDLGALYASLEDTDAAEFEFHEAIKHDPNDADAHYELGVLLLTGRDNKNSHAAEREFKRTKAIDPYSVRAVLALSLCYRLDNRLDDAEQELSRAIKHFRQARYGARPAELWRLHVELAAMLIDRGNRDHDNKVYGNAYAEARAAIALAGGAWETHYVAAVAAERRGLFRDAASHWRDCQELGGDTASIESLRNDVKNSRIEAWTRAAIPLISGSFSLCLFAFIVLALVRLDKQPVDVLLVVIAAFIATLLIAVFPNRLVKFSIAKVVTAELAVLSDQSLPAGPIGQLPAVSGRFDLLSRPFGQQLRRN